MFLSTRRVLSTFRMFSSAASDEVLFEVKNNVGIITLNRSKVLNSLNEPMVSAIYSKLKEWENERSFVIVKGAGEKAFCAGGDVVSATRNTSEGIEFFRKEYTMDYLIGMYKKPFISLCDGITMGGGVGISVHGPYRIATEKTLFAMPETAIGLFPDVGGSYFLPRLQGKLGLFLGLTGFRLKGIDVVKAGVATHFIPSENVTDLFNKLVNSDADSIEDILNKTTVDISGKDFTLSPYLDLINSCFGGESIEQIQVLLQNEGSQWSKNTLELLSKVSPASLKITKREIDLGASQNLRSCFITEFRLARAALKKTISPDFYEGVRALLVDKDKNPKWSPASLQDISDSDVEKCFAPLPSGEELDI
ncbi:3-hydroxyisobutyryl-CoA hydrolase, mitochondrial isoform X2 [Planococcus citri]